MATVKVTIDGEVSLEEIEGAIAVKENKGFLFKDSEPYEDTGKKKNKVTLENTGELPNDIKLTLDPLPVTNPVTDMSDYENKWHGKVYVKSKKTAVFLWRKKEG